MKMFFELVKNPVVISVVVLLILSAIRLNVVFALILASIVGGVAAGFGCPETMKAFLGAGLANGAELAFNYAMLGAFSIAISRSGITELLTQALFKRIGGEATPKKIFAFKYTLLLILTLAAVSSQNLIPVHIAFIPVLIPPLLQIFEMIRLDRRAVACILTFGLITPYMVMPFGFGRIYLNDILIANIVSNGVEVTKDMAPKAMFMPALGMIAGLLLAVFFSYRKPRDYDEKKTAEMDVAEKVEIRPWKVGVGVVSILFALAGQIWMDSLVIAALAGILVFVVSGVISLRGTQDIFVRGVHLMGGIGIIMIAANGFAEVMKETGSVNSLVELVSTGIGDQHSVAR